MLSLEAILKKITSKDTQKFIGIDKFERLGEIISHNGGLRASLYKLFKQDDLKIGTFVGEDNYGNKYYENKTYFFGRSRWVEFADHVGWDYDASQVPAEWFGWLHYKTDLPPHKDQSRPKYSWMAKHTENRSGTSGAFMPYNTVPTKIQQWEPPRK